MIIDCFQGRISFEMLIMLNAIFKIKCEVILKNAKFGIEYAITATLGHFAMPII